MQLKLSIYKACWSRGFELAMNLYVVLLASVMDRLEEDLNGLAKHGVYICYVNAHACEYGFQFLIS
jgi:hypothetical protein